jgi:two-component system sensor histidine kinase PilS (NtrC family)
MVRTAPSVLPSAPPTLPPTPAARTDDFTARLPRLLTLFRWLAPVLLCSIWAIGGSYHLVGSLFPRLFIGVSGIWLAFGLLLPWLANRQQTDARHAALLGVVVDGAALTLLTAASGGVESGLPLLALVPLGGTALLLEWRSALLAAAVGSLLLLLQQAALTASGLAEGIGALAQTGYFGGTYFLVAASGAFLAKQLRETQALVQQRDLDLANLAELSEYIVQHLREALLVVDADNRLRLVNPAATHLLGKNAIAGRNLAEAAPQLQSALAQWRQQPTGVTPTKALQFPSADASHEVEPHFASLGKKRPGPVLVFLEDLSRVAATIQQTKLAALGRLSASIAHEIRNPVGAMSHAAQLLAESPGLSPEDRRLTEIMHSHGQRVSQIVTSVQQLSRRESANPERLELSVWLPSFLDELAETLEWPRSSLTLLGTAGLEVRVDPVHLRQVLWNLGENAINALRNTESSPAIEWVYGRLVGGRPYLEVADRGPGIPPGITEHLFEPFFSGRAGGTGLGLFIARELAACSGATLRHEPRPGGGSLFRIVFADPQRWEA